MSETVQGWWFSKLSDPVRLPHGDGRAVVVGEMLSVEEPIVLREHGLHASAKALDALRYAPGMMVARVELSGHIIRGDNKIVATHRKTLWMADATKTLQWFAVWCASRALSRERDAGRVPDKRSLDAVRVTTEYLLGRATKNDVISARAAAADAAAAAAAAYAYADAAADADAAAAAAAADAAYAAAAADAAVDAAAAVDADAVDAYAAARDKSLADYAEAVVQILIEMKAPGCQWLALTEAA